MTDPALHITQTKIIIPRRRNDLLSRPRLLDQFHNLLDSKLVTITAPAGYGKTSLLIDVVHQSTMPVCWFTIDALDNDSHRFVHHFLAALAESFPCVGEWFAKLLADGSFNLKSLVGPIVNIIYQYVQEYFVLVLDDFHLITNPEVIEFIDLFIQRVDENCRLVIASRGLINLPNVLLLAGRSEVSGLGPSDLAFQPTEIQALFSQNYNCSISVEAADKLARETEGWITGLLLSTQTLLDNVVDRLHQAQISGERVYDYLANQVLKQQPASVQDFLLRTSLLEEVSAELCCTVFGPAHYPDGYTWQSLTQLVIRNNLFVLRLDDRTTWFRYHQLFREFLQNRIEGEQPDEMRRILQKLAAYYFEKGEWEKTQALYVRLGDLEAVADLIEHTGLQLVQTGRFNILETWFESLPASLMANRPLLLALNGYTSAMLGRVKHALTLLGQAEAAFEKADNIVGLARTLVWRSGAHRLLSHHQAALADANRGLALAQLGHGSLSLKALALKARGQCLLDVRNSADAVADLEESLALFKALGLKENEARLYLETGVAYLTLGRYERAACYFELASRRFSVTGNATRLADLFNNWGVLEYLTGHYRSAIQKFEQALDYARQSSYARMEAYTLCGIADVYFDLEALDAAECAYNRAQRVALKIDDSFLLIYLELKKTAVARKRNHINHAWSLLNYAGDMINKSGSDYFHGLYWIETGLLAKAKNCLPSAISNFKKAITYFDGQGQPVEKSRAYLYLASVCYAAKQPQLALQHLQTALTLISVLESVHPLVGVGKETIALLQYAQQHRELAQHVSRLLVQIDSFGRSVSDYRREMRRQTLEVPFASPKLVFRLLGPVEVYLDDEAVSGPEWSHRQARELLFYLLAHPQGASKEVIGYELWPECTVHELKMRFKNGVYRLRRVLGDTCINYNQVLDRYTFNRKFDYECDVELFEWYLDQAKTAAKTDAKILNLRLAIDLYRGPYLLEVESVWVLPERQRLHYLHVQAHLKLANLYFDAKNHQAALEHCWQVLQVEPGQELAHRLAMKIHAARGNRGAVIRQFKACQSALQQEINVPVSAETRALFSSLVH